MTRLEQAFCTAFAAVPTRLKLLTLKQNARTRLERRQDAISPFQIHTLILPYATHYPNHPVPPPSAEAVALPRAATREPCTLGA